MKQISTAGRYYLAFCLATCGYFYSAAINAWPGPSFGTGSSSSGHSYSSGYYSGRSSGGFGGGGK